MVRLGVIGCGRIGRVHADSIDVHPRAELARVYDPFEAAAREVGARFGAEWGTDVDAVHRATRRSTPWSSPRRRRRTSTC